MTLAIDGDSLSLRDLVRVARGDEHVSIAPEALERMSKGRAVVETALARGDEVYGLTTGVGERKSVRLDPEEIDAYNRLLILNHRVGQQPMAEPDVVRATMLRLANGLVAGTVGVRPELAHLVVDALNAGDQLPVRSRGSIGQADLAPMADLAHGLLEGSGFRLGAGEGLGLIDNNAFSTGSGALAVWDCARLLDTLDVAGALSLEAFGGNLSILDMSVARSRPFPGVLATIERLRALLDGSDLWKPGGPRNLQDPLCFRTMPQVHGAARDTYGFIAGQLEIELNASQGNPVVDPELGTITSAGNFDAFALAAALDQFRIVLATVLTSVAERSLKLVHAPFSGLPHGLAARDGLAEDALNMFGVSVQALVADARALAAPVSYEVISSTQAAGIEDRATMAPLAARRLAEMVSIGEGIAAIELCIGAQGVDLRAGHRLGHGSARARDLVRSVVAMVGEGEPAPQDLDPIIALVRDGGFAAIGNAGGVEP
jgi:histidine ammonia-lyase